MPLQRMGNALLMRRTKLVSTTECCCGACCVENICGQAYVVSWPECREPPEISGYLGPYVPEGPCNFGYQNSAYFKAFDYDTCLALNADSNLLFQQFINFFYAASAIDPGAVISGGDFGFALSSTDNPPKYVCINTSQAECQEYPVTFPQWYYPVPAPGTFHAGKTCAEDPCCGGSYTCEQSYFVAGDSQFMDVLNNWQTGDPDPCETAYGAGWLYAGTLVCIAPPTEVGCCEQCQYEHLTEEMQLGISCTENPLP